MNAGGARPAKYECETEAVLNALTYSALIATGKLPLNSLTLEPGPFYGNVDLVFCESGLRWEHETSSKILIEIENLGAFNQDGTLPGFWRNVIREGVNQIVSAKQRDSLASALLAIGFTGYDTPTKKLTEEEKLKIVDPIIRNQLEVNRVSKNFIDWIVH